MKAITVLAVFVVIHSNVHADDRVAMERPQYNCEMEEDERIWQEERQYGWQQMSRENVHCMYEEESGRYIFTYPSHDGKRRLRATWEPGWNIDVVVAARVERGDQNDLLYMYSLTSATTSKQNVVGFILTCESWPNDIQLPSDEWIGYRLPEDVWEQKLQEWSVRGDARPGEVLRPGGCVEGFGVASAYLPEILPCWARGEGEPLTLEGEEFPYVIERKMPRSLLETSVHGRTVGPGKSRNPASWERMQGFLGESKKQRWVKPDILEEVENLIARAESAELSGDRRIYREMLVSLLETIDTLHRADKPQMTSEGYALFYFHVKARLDILDKEAHWGTE